MRYIGRLRREHERNLPFKPYTWKQGKAILALFSRQYWRRIWIIQEIVLAKDIIVFCGQESVHWSSFNTLYEHLRTLQAIGRMEHLHFAWHVFDSDAMRIAAKRLVWRSLPHEAKGFPLKELLQDFAHMQSTEVNDKVYDLMLNCTKSGLATSMYFLS
jgi:hypothetical protein